MTPQDLDDIFTHKIVVCLQSRTYSWQIPGLEVAFAGNSARNSFAKSSLSPLASGNLPRELADLAAARVTLSEQRAKLAALPATPQGYEALGPIREAAAKALKLVWPSERASFQSAVL